MPEKKNFLQSKSISVNHIIGRENGGLSTLVVPKNKKEEAKEA
jgi:hypothetical protein